MLFGDWPTRDFQDPGLPLMDATSALAQRLLGPTLFSEAVLVTVAFGAAAALTIVLVDEITGSMWLAIGAAAFEVAIVPRTYSYPKMFLYAAGFLAFQRYIVKPTTIRRVGMAALVAVAFLFRHDHGLFLWAGGALATALAPGAASVSVRARLRSVALFTATVVAFLIPYLLYVQLGEGLWLYVRTAIAFSEREASKGGRPWPSPFGADAAYGALVSLFHALPLLALAAAFALRKRGEASARFIGIVPVAIVAVLVNVSFIRDPLATRIADAIVPAVVLGAWLAAHATTSARPWLFVPVAAAVIAVAAWATLAVGHTREEVGRMGINSLATLPERFAQRTEQLRARFDPQQMPTRTVARLMPFFGYLDRCTSETDRLLMTGFLPEVPYYARRAFAGGQDVFMYGYYGSADNQRQVVDRLRGQSAPFVIVPSDYADDFEKDFPIVHAWVMQRYVRLAAIDVDDNLTVTVLVDRTRPPRSRDDATGWPCFR